MSAALRVEFPVVWAMAALLAVSSSVANSEPVEVMESVRWSRCNAELCFRIEAEVAVRSPLDSRYVLEKVTFTAVQKRSSKIVRTFKAQTALASRDWDDWFFQVDERRSWSFDSRSGKLY